MRSSFLMAAACILCACCWKSSARICVRQTFRTSFIFSSPFMFGIYPYTSVTEKQMTAMKEAGIDYVYQTVYELTCSCLSRIPKTVLYYDRTGSGRSRQTRTYFETKRNTSVF